MECYACGQEATQRCSRCGNSYCADHGQDPSSGSGQALCDDCLSPLNAAPSAVAFRASLLGLLIGSVLALWLLVRPPSLPGESSEALLPPPGESAPGATAVTTPTPTAAGALTAPSPTPAPTPQPTPPGPIQYTVAEGDTWYGIAGLYRDTIPGATLDDDAAQLAAANGRTLTDFLQVGEVIDIPR